jgi:hypothetical protein
MSAALRAANSRSQPASSVADSNPMSDACRVAFRTNPALGRLMSALKMRSRSCLLDWQISLHFATCRSSDSAKDNCKKKSFSRESTCVCVCVCVCGEPASDDEHSMYSNSPSRRFAFRIFLFTHLTYIEQSIETHARTNHMLLTIDASSNSTMFNVRPSRTSSSTQRSSSARSANDIRHAMRYFGIG